MERLSVIIPAYQAEKYLAEAVISARTQKWPGQTEILIINDGSTDRTLEIAQNLGDIVLTLPRGGAAKARNAGLRASSGQWVLLLDADDILFPDALTRLRTPFYARPELYAVFGRAKDFISPELTTEEKKNLPSRKTDYGGILPGCALLRRQIFEQIGFFDETLDSGETVAWQIKLRKAGLPVEQIDAVTLRRRIHLTNTGRTDRTREMQNYAAVLRKKMRGE